MTFRSRTVLAALLAVSPAAGHAEDVALPEGGQHLMHLARPVQRVAVGDPHVADVRLVTPKELRVLGGKRGTTDLMVWPRGSADPVTYHLSVGADIAGLKAALAGDPDLARIGVTGTGRSVILDGRVPTAAAHARLMAIAAAEVGKDVTDLTTVAQSQMVAVEVRFAAISVTALKALGINLQRLGNGFQFASAAPSTVSDFSFLGGNLSVTSGLPLAQAFNLLMAWPHADFAGVVSALDQADLARLLAKPTLLVRSGESASFLAGGEIPVPVPQVGSVANAITIDYHKFGVQLKLSATVLDNNRIVIRANPEVSELDPTNAVQIQGYTVPAIKTRATETTVELGDGQSFVLAGLMYSADTAIEDKVPGIGDLPVIGSFFKRSQETHERQELVIIATPHLVAPMKPGEMPRLPGEDMAAYAPTAGDMLLNTGSLDDFVVRHGLMN